MVYGRLVGVKIVGLNIIHLAAYSLE